MSDLWVAGEDDHSVEVIRTIGLDQKRDVVKDYRVGVCRENVGNSGAKFNTDGGVHDFFEVAAGYPVIENQSTESGAVEFAVRIDHSHTEPVANRVECWATAALHVVHELVRGNDVRTEFTEPCRDGRLPRGDSAG